MEKPNFAENLARSTNNNLNVYFLSQSKLNAESMKAYLSGGDKLKNVVDTLDRAIEDKRNSPTFREDVKSAQDKLKNQVEIQKKKIEEKERKLNDATMDKEKLDHTITQKMVV
jgi:predicted ribosome quality control (RQC) complex YloA/Tae2 family protein